MAWSNPLEGLKPAWNNNPLDGLISQDNTNPLDGLVQDSQKDSPWEVDFWDVIDFFNKPENSSLRWFVPAIQALAETLDAKNLPEVNTQLSKLIKSNNHQQVLFYIGKLQEIQARYDEETWELIKTAKGEESALSQFVKWTKNVVGSAADKLKPRVITDEEFAQITWIDINGSQSVWELTDSIKKFGSRISKWELGKNLDNDQRQAILDQLSQIIKWKEDAEEIWHRQIENYFDWLAQNIRKRWGKFVVTLEKWETKSFDSQTKAVDFVKELKSSAEFHFQSWLRTFMEYTFIWAWNLLLAAEWLVWSIPAKLKEWWWEWLTLDIVSFDNVAAILLYLWSGAISLALISAHWAIPIWVASSFWRRVVTDNLQKYNSDLQYTDYARGQVTSATEMSSKEAKDFMEMKQRQQIMDLLWADLETNYAQWSKKYNEYRKVIEKIDSYKLNRTPTFYYLAYKYWKLSWTLERYRFNIVSVALRGARFYHPDFARDENGKKTSKLPIWSYNYVSYENSKALASDTLTKLLDVEAIREGVEIFYKNKTVDRVSKDKEPPKIEVTGDDTKTDKYTQVIDEINARNIPESEKKKLLKNFDDYVNKLVDFPKSPKVMARDLHILLNTDHGQKADFIRQLRTKINKVKEDNGRVKNSLWKVGKWKLGRFNAFLSLVERWEWVWSKKEFDSEVKKIEAKSDYKVSPNYNARLWSVDFDQELQDIFDRGESAAKTHKVVLWEFYDNTRVWSWDSMPWKDFDSAASHETELMKWIQDYIDFGIHDDALENFAKNEVKEMFDKIISWKIMIEDENRLFAEIDNMFKWYLPTYKLVARLSDIVEANKKHKNIDDVKKLYEEAKKWRLNMSPKDLLELEKDLWSFDYTVDRSRWVPVSEKSKMERLVKDTQGWRNFDYNKTFGLSENATTSDYLDKLKGNFSWELELLQVVDVVNDTNTKSWIIAELWEFSKALSKNRYSKWQADHILREIFAGKAFSTITLPMIWDAPDFYDGKSELSDKLDKDWNSLSDDKKLEKAKRIKSNPNIDESKITIIDIKRAITEIDWSWERAETLKRQKNQIKAYTEQLNSAEDFDEMRSIRDQFNNYISSSTNKINTEDPEFKTLIEEFNESFTDKRSELRKAPKTGPDTSPSPEEAAKPEELESDTNPEKSETTVKSWKLNAAAKKVVESAEYMLMANEFSTRDGASILTQEIEQQLLHLREIWGLPDWTGVKELSLDEFREQLKIQLNLDRIPKSVDEAKALYERYYWPDRDLRIAIETKMKTYAWGEPRSWDALIIDERINYIDGMTDEWRERLRILQDNNSPADSLRQARISIKNILTNMR